MTKTKQQNEAKPDERNRFLYTQKYNWKAIYLYMLEQIVLFKKSNIAIKIYT